MCVILGWSQQLSLIMAPRNRVSVALLCIKSKQVHWESSLETTLGPEASHGPGDASPSSVGATSVWKISLSEIMSMHCDRAWGRGKPQVPIRSADSSSEWCPCLVCNFLWSTYFLPVSGMRVRNACCLWQPPRLFFEPLFRSCLCNYF